MLLAARFMVCPYDGKTSILPSSTGVRLQGSRMEARDFAEVLLQFLTKQLVNNVLAYRAIMSHLDDSAIALHLVERDKRMDRAELWPCQRNHAASAVELHGTTTKGYHTVNQSDIFRG